MRSTIKWGRTVLTVLLLGAIINVAVAWGIALKGQNAIGVWGNVFRSHMDDPTWYGVRSRGFGSEQVLVTNDDFLDSRCEFSAQRFPGWSIVRARPFAIANAAEGQRDFWYESAFGWPWSCMIGRVHLGSDLSTVDDYWWAASLNDQTQVHLGGRILPLLPVWPGFAFDTFFFAVILWAMFAGLFTLRRWRRIKRGLCPTCAYPIGTSPVCTECGTPLPARATR